MVMKEISIWQKLVEIYEYVKAANVYLDTLKKKAFMF